MENPPEQVDLAELPADGLVWQPGGGVTSSNGLGDMDLDTHPMCLDTLERMVVDEGDGKAELLSPAASPASSLSSPRDVDDHGHRLSQTWQTVGGDSVLTRDVVPFSGVWLARHCVCVRYMCAWVCNASASAWVHAADGARSTNHDGTLQSCLLHSVSCFRRAASPGEGCGDAPTPHTHNTSSLCHVVWLPLMPRCTAHRKTSLKYAAKTEPLSSTSSPATRCGSISKHGFRSRAQFESGSESTVSPTPKAVSSKPKIVRFRALEATPASKLTKTLFSRLQAGFNTPHPKITNVIQDAMRYNRTKVGSAATSNHR